MNRLRRAIAIAVMSVLSIGLADAQQRSDADAARFPSRAIRIIVPFPAGGPADVLARLIGQKMSEDWGQPAVIDGDR